MEDEIRHVIEKIRQAELAVNALKPEWRDSSEIQSAAQAFAKAVGLHDLEVLQSLRSAAVARSKKYMANVMADTDKADHRRKQKNDSQKARRAAQRLAKAP